MASILRGGWDLVYGHRRIYIYIYICNMDIYIYVYAYSLSEKTKVSISCFHFPLTLYTSVGLLTAAAHVGFGRVSGCTKGRQILSFAQHRRGGGLVKRGVAKKPEKSAIFWF